MKKKITNILAILCLCVAVGCALYLGIYYYKSAKSEKAVSELSNMIIKTTETKKSDEKPITNLDSADTKSEPNLVNVDGVFVQNKFSSIYRMNRDFLGWLTIEDTHIDYPVMFTPNDSEHGEFYIHRDFDKNYSAAGLPFVDKNCRVKNPTDNVIIYGHNMNSGTMFHDIIKYENKDFYESHKKFHFDSIYEDAEYEVVAMFYGEIYDINDTRFKYYQFVNAANEEEFLNFIQEIKKMSIINTGVDVQYGDHLLTLSTCAYHVEDGRFAVVAKKIESETK
ncbi:MAG: class B sortase [Eubacteriales bacterium]|nr:class B sortase [Eubacteriales bacterium]